MNSLQFQRQSQSVVSRDDTWQRWTRWPAAALTFTKVHLRSLLSAPGVHVGCPGVRPKPFLHTVPNRFLWESLYRFILMFADLI